MMDQSFVKPKRILVLCEAQIDLTIIRNSHTGRFNFKFMILFTLICEEFVVQISQQVISNFIFLINCFVSSS